MSHFTKIDQANIVSINAFVAACIELGLITSLTSVRKSIMIKDYYGHTMSADVAVPVGKYDIALVKNSQGTYDMIADWWGVRTQKLPDKLRACRSDDDLQHILLRYTTKHTIIDRYRAQGWQAKVKEENDELKVELIRYR